MFKHVLRFITVAVLAGGLIGLTSTVSAEISSPVTTLTHRNTTVQIDTSGPNAGMFSWTIDGVDQFYKTADTTGKQWFWYRVGANGPERSLDTLTLLKSEVTDRTLDMVYGDTELGFTIDVYYLLSGGSPGSAVSDMAETISINNLNKEESLDFHFFQYSDLDLNGTPNDDSAMHANNNAIRQWDPSIFFSETVVTPGPDHWEIAPWATTINKLNDGVADNLSDASAFVGPTDVAWAFQWDRIIGPDGTFQISKDKNIHIVPTPAAILLGMIGLGIVHRVKRRLSTI
jgi:hypothetical protein